MRQQIYLVGGAVRDQILGREIKDKDYVAVGYGPEAFSHLKQVGKDFPVFLREDGCELALARVERKTGVGYNGFEVATKEVGLEEDLKRRDLTLNSIAYNEESKTYIDPYGGMEDIKNKTLRHTSEAFCEDPLRVLRLARFRATLTHAWRIHPSTKALVYTMREELSHLQSDRVWKEIEKVLVLSTAPIFFETLFELGVLDVIFPHIYALTTLKEGTSYHQEGSLFIHTMMVMRRLEESSPLLKLIALYHDIAKPYCYRKYGNSAGHEKRELVEERIDIQIPAKLKNRMLFLIANHTRISQLDTLRYAKLATFFESFKRDRELFCDLLHFFDADNHGRITDAPKEALEEEKLLKIFDMISAYSPKEWINSQETPPQGEAISQHIHAYNISIIKKWW